jgi:hypothetical protein
VTAGDTDLVHDTEPGPGFLLGRWPFGILAVAALRIFDAVTLAAIGLGLQGLPVAGLAIVASSPNLTRIIDLLLAAAIIVGIVGLLAYRRWGWVLTMILVGLGLAHELFRIWIGQPDHLGLLLLVVSAFYLNQRSVRAMAGQLVDQERPTGA